MISGVRAGFSASLSGCFCSAMRSLSADDSVHNRRAAALPFASLVVHWASTSLLPALQALGFGPPRGGKTPHCGLFSVSSQSTRCGVFTCIACCSLGFRLAASRTAGARLCPLRIPTIFMYNKAPMQSMGALLWRRGWDSNPRDVSAKLISSQPRYDHFDTSARMPPQRRGALQHQTVYRKRL